MRMLRKPLVIFSLYIILWLLTVEPLSASEIKIVVAGDTCFSGRLELTGKKFGYDFFLESVQPFVQSADFAILNLETCVSLRGEPQKGKEFVFRSRPESLKAIKNAGFSAVSVANNHSLDFGKQAFLDTLDKLAKTGILYAGGGLNSDEAYAPAIYVRNGVKIAFFAFTDVLPPGFASGKGKAGVADSKHPEKLSKLIKGWDGKADLIVVSMHWGKELSQTPTERQVQLAKMLVDSGADLVIGHHPHVVQPAEVYRNRLILYSLGNFIFSSGSPAGNYSLIAKVRLADTGEFREMEALPLKIVSGKPVVYSKGWINDLKKILEARSLRFSLSKGRIWLQSSKKLPSFLRPVLYFEKKYFKNIS